MQLLFCWSSNSINLVLSIAPAAKINCLPFIFIFEPSFDSASNSLKLPLLTLSFVTVALIHIFGPFFESNIFLKTSYTFLFLYEGSFAYRKIKFKL